ncbi:MAG: hypothetical protein MJ239_04510 [Bacilli bacterium]|nr:hypothetical protein [Bacilli bacterium]
MKKKIRTAETVKLPHNYRELFFDVIAQNWRKLLLIGFFYFVFLLPTLAVLFFKDYYTLTIASSSYTDAEKEALKITAENYFNAGAVVAFALSSIGFAGTSRVMLLLSREEGVFFFADLGKGIKQNVGPNLVFFIIYSTLLYVALLIMNNIKASFWPYIPLGIIQGIIFPLVLVNAETCSVYSWRMGDRFHNSVLIFIKNFIFVVLFSLLFTAPLFLLAIENIYLRYILLAAAILLFMPIAALFIRVYFNYVLDRDINKKNYPEIYKKGIYPLENEEEK